MAGDTSLTRVSTATATQLTFLSPDRAQPMHLRRICLPGERRSAPACTCHEHQHGGALVDPGAGCLVDVARITTTGTPVFTYYDAAGAATSVAANVRTVRIRVTVAPVSGSRILAYDTRVSLRPAA